MALNRFNSPRFDEEFVSDLADEVDKAAICVAVSEEPSADIARELLSLALFDAGARAITETPSGGLLAGMATRDEAASVIAMLSRSHADLIAKISIAAEPDVHWTETQRGGFTPTSVGPWRIRTPWTRPPESIKGRYDLQIDPGAAFGHGAHPTTRLALALLTPWVGPSVSVVDLGTGTGVLAIAAARLGADVLAIDNSDVALETARKNLSLNAAGDFAKVADRVSLRAGDIGAFSHTDEDLVVANVTMDVQRLIAPALTAAPRVIISGILCRQVCDIFVAYPNHRAKIVKTVGEWAAVEFVGPARAAEGITR